MVYCNKLDIKPNEMNAASLRTKFTPGRPKVITQSGDQKINILNSLMVKSGDLRSEQSASCNSGKLSRK